MTSASRTAIVPTMNIAPITNMATPYARYSPIFGLSESKSAPVLSHRFITDCPLRLMNTWEIWLNIDESICNSRKLPPWKPAPDIGGSPIMNTAIIARGMTTFNCVAARILLSAAADFFPASSFSPTDADAPAGRVYS